MDKKIGIVAWSTGDNGFGCTKTYMEFFNYYGQVELLTPSKNIRKDIDLVVLPGGLDTASSNYGEKPGFMNSSTDVYKDYFVKQNLPQYIEAGIPIFGICLGFQQLAVYFDCKLTQHMFWHEQSKARWEEAHEIISIASGELGLFKIPTVEAKQKVNSHHHQGLLEGDESNGIIPIIKTDDNVIEAFVHPTLPIAGVNIVRH